MRNLFLYQQNGTIKNKKWKCIYELDHIFIIIIKTGFQKKYTDENGLHFMHVFFVSNTRQKK